MVFAASSLVEVLEPVGAAFTKEEEISVSFSFGGSDSLAQQLRRGAYADVYVSAGNQPMNMLEKAGLLINRTRSDILSNQLVVVSRHELLLEFDNSDLFLSSEISRIAMTDPNLAPAGRYSKSVLQNAGVWEQIQDKIVFAPNVRATLAYVESGNADIGIVYRTDSTRNERTRVILDLPKGGHDPIIYPASVLRHSDNKEEAIRFLSFLTSGEVKNWFREYGFIAVD